MGEKGKKAVVAAEARVRARLSGKKKADAHQECGETDRRPFFCTQSVSLLPRQKEKDRVFFCVFEYDDKVPAFFFLEKIDLF